MGVEILQGDCREVLAGLPAQSVQCCITSPPYYSLRDYGTATWEGGDAACDHRKVQDAARAIATSTLGGGKATTGHMQEGYKVACARCGARRIDRQIGMEQTPAAYVAHLVEVFAQVKRVLRPDGLLFVVMGDSYAGSWGNQGRKGERGTQRPINGPMMQNLAAGYPERSRNTGTIRAGMPPAKNLLGIPWRVAFALQDDGWILRAEIIWSKPSCMPESVGDRCTRSHETVFMLAKGPRYYYDQDAIREDMACADRVKREAARGMDAVLAFKRDSSRHDGAGGLTHAQVGARTALLARGGRNKRSVWTIDPQPFRAAAYGVKDTDHYAVMPEALVTPMILAGTSEAGACSACLAPYRRVVERTARDSRRVIRTRNVGGRTDGFTRATASGGLPPVDLQTTGWAPGCSCQAGSPVGCTTLDPFLGSGTVALVSKRLGRSCVGIELNPAYAEMARRRVESVPYTLFSATGTADDGAAAR